MGAILVSGPQYGQIYNINIAGSTPTPEEQQRIDQWVGEQEQIIAAKSQEMFGAPTQAEAPASEVGAQEEERDRTAFERGYARDPYQTRRAFGVAEEYLADTGIGRLLGFDAEEARKRQQEAEKELRRLEQEDPSVGFRDIEGVGTAASFAGEQIGTEARDLAIQTGATVGGSIFGPVGAAAGRALGVGYTTAMAAPQLFAEAIEKQKEAGGEINLTKALGATTANLLSEFVTDYFIVGKLLKPAGGSRLKRAIAEGGKGAGTEGAQEVSTVIVNRVQAGLPLDSEDALMEYAEAFTAGASVGGPAAGAFASISPISPNQIDQDLTDEDPDRVGYDPKGTVGQPEFDKVINEPEVLLLEDQRPQLLIEQGVDPYEAEGFTINEYNAVLEQIINDGELLFPKAQAAIREQTGREKVPTKVVRDIASVLEREGKISKSPRAKLDKYTLTPVNQRAQEAIDNLRRDTNNALDAIRKITKTIPRLELDVRYAEQTGKDTSGKPVNAEDVRKKLENKQVLLNKLDERLQRNQEKLRSVNQDFNVPVTEKIGLPATKIRVQDFINSERTQQKEQLERSNGAAAARTAADIVRQRKEENAEARTEEYRVYQSKILSDLRDRLKKIGLGDVSLKGLSGDKDYEGVSYISPEGDQVIALSMGIYSPTITPDAYNRRLGDVMNHEVIHSIRNLGLFTNKELQLLSKAARKTKYVKRVGDKNVRREYTYFDRAQRINPELSRKKDKNNILSSLEEEAIAEMFRDYSAGKLTKIGQSRSLLKRIADFFRSMVGAHVDSGFNSVDKIFGGIGEGTVGARPRVAAAPQAVAPEVEAQPTTTPPPAADTQGVATVRNRLTAPATLQSTQEPKFSRIFRTYGVENLQDIIRNNPNGFTVDAVTRRPIESGFSVAPIKQAEIKIAGDLPEQVLVEYIRDNKDIARAVKRPVYLGGWLNTQTGIYTLDNILIVPTLEEAMYIADAAKQDAVFELNRDPETGFPRGEVRTDAGLQRIRDAGTYRSDARLRYQRDIERLGRRFEAARNKRNALGKEQLIGRPDPKFSRLSPDEARRRGQQARDRRRRDESGKLTPLEGAPVVEGAAGPDQNIVSLAERYARENNINLLPQSEYVDIDPDRASRLARAYEDMKNNPQNPAVKSAYRNLIKQTKAQYDTLVNDGYEFTFFDSNSDPYNGNPWNAMRDLRTNKRMAVYGTYDGYGSKEITPKDIANNPLLEDTGLRWPDQNGVMRNVTANDLFRAVHDVFGHGLEGAGFRARGEENAWQAHARLFTGSALGALTSETRGQNSWVNFGPYGDANSKAKVGETIFADQKIGLMPEWTWKEGRAGDAGLSIEDTDQEVEFPNYDNSVPVKTSRIYQPERTVKAYKMFTLGSDGQLYPLFVNADEAIPVGEWVGATFPLTFEVDGKKYVPSRGAVDDFGKPTKGTGDYKEVPDEATRQQLLDNGFKVSRPSKSAPHGKVLAVAARPGFHAGTLPKANHLGRTMPLTDEQAKIMRDAGYGASIKTREGKSYLKLRHPNHVWAEVLYPDNSHGTDWQSMADQTNTKDINDEMPIGGHYRYTQGAAGKDETWVISGDMLVNRILDPKEVDAIVGSNSKIPDNPRLDQVAEILGEQAAIDGQAALGQSRRYSRLTIPLTQEQRDASILDYIDPNTGRPLFNAKSNSIRLADFANKLLSLRNTRSYDIVNSEQDREEVARIFAAEMEAALLSSRDAIGWYDATLKLAKRILSVKYPEVSRVLSDGSINSDYNPNAEAALDFATAVTSNGMAVTDNYDFAAEQYEALRGSQDGKFPILGRGDQGAAMLGAFEFWNALVDRGYTPVQIDKLLMTETRRNQIDEIVAEAFGVDKKDLPKQFKASGAEAANEIVSVAYVLGPKIGNGFYRNIRGNFNAITMDRWWMRFINRITGNPLMSVSDQTIEKNINNIWRQIENQDLLQELDKEVLSLSVAQLNKKRINRSDMQDLIPLMNKEYEKIFKKTYDDKIKQLEADGYSSKDAATRRIAQEARPIRTPFLKNVGTYVSNIKKSEGATLQEQPRNKTDRIAMRDVTARAKRIIEDSLGIEITNADIQALMWYAEKRIFAAGGVRKGRGEDNDYADGAIYVLKKRGVNDERIESALPAAERRRVRAISNELKADNEANGTTVTVDAPRRGDFFGPRRDVLESREGVVPESYNARYSRLPQYARVGQAGVQGVGPADLAARAEMIRYTKVQDVMAKYLAKVPFISDKAAKEKTEAFMVKLQDSMLPVGKMYDTLREKYGPNVITQDMDAYFQESLMHGVSGPKKEKFDRTSFKPVLEQVANMNVTDQENSALGNVSGYYRDIFKKHGNKSHALANAYLYALHAKERNARISEASKGTIQDGSGMSDQEADSIIAFVNSLPPAKQQVLRNIDSQVQGMIKQTNEVYIDGGLIPDYMLSEDVDDKTKAKFNNYKNYVPLRGFADPEIDIDISEQSFSPAGQKFGSIGKPNRAALGRSSYAGDILANVAVQHHQAIDKAERNKVGQALLKLLESKDIDTSEFGVVLDQHPMKRAMVNGTIRYVPDRNFDSYEQRKDVEDAIENGPILAVRRDGKEYLLALDDKIARAMKGSMSPQQMKAPINFLHNITRLYANLLTSYNPAFFLSNWPRDIETAIFNSQQYEMRGASKDIIKNVPKAAGAILKIARGKEGANPYWAKRYQEFYENGGQNVLNQMSDQISASQDITKTINNIVEADSKGLTKKVRDGFIGKGASILGYVEAVNTAVENSTRLAFFDRMLSELKAQNVPEKEALKRAAFAARNLTTNFTKGGEMKNGFNTFYLFFNASMQGSMAVFNSLVNSRKARQLAGSIVVLGFLMDQINAAISEEDEETGKKDYDSIDEYTRGHNLILPDIFGTGNYIKIPMAYGLNTFFNLGRITSNLIRGGMGDVGTYTPQKAGKELVGYVTEMINPLGGTDALSAVVPTALDLPVELLRNKDFRDASIYKELSPYQPYLSRSSLHWSTTSPSAIWISKFINDTLGGGDDYIPGEILGMRVDIQPDVIEHIYSFMTGGVGRLVGQSIDTATSTVPNAVMGEWESDMIRGTPFLNKFMTTVTEKDRSSDYYEKRDDVFAVRRSFRAALQNGDQEQAINIRRKYPEIVRIMEPVNKIDRAITKLRKRLKMVKANKRIGDAQRKELIDKIEDRIYLLQSRGIQLMQGI